MSMFNILPLTQTSAYFTGQAFPIERCNLSLLGSHIIHLLMQQTGVDVNKIARCRWHVAKAVDFAAGSGYTDFDRETYFTLRNGAKDHKYRVCIHNGINLIALFTLTGSLETHEILGTFYNHKKVSPYFLQTPAFAQCERVIEELKSSDEARCSLQERIDLLLGFCEYLEQKGLSKITLDTCCEYAARFSHGYARNFWICIKKLDRIFNLHWEVPGKYEPLTPLPLPDYPKAVERFKECVQFSKSKPISVLIVIALSELDNFGESALTIGRYFNIFRRFRWFCFKRGIEDYRTPESQLYLDFVRKLAGPGKQYGFTVRIAIRAIKILEHLNQSEVPFFQTNPFARSSIILCEPSLEALRGEVKRWILVRGMVQATAVHYDYVLRKLIEICDLTCREDLKTLSPADIEKLLEYFASKRNKASRRTALNALKKLLNYLYEQGDIRSNLAQEVILPRIVKNYVAPFLTIEDQARVHAALENESPRSRAIVLLAMQLGLRDSDICNLRLSNLDFRRKRISLNQKKTGELITHVLYKEIGQAIKQYLKERPRPYQDDEPIFCRSRPPFEPLTSVYTIVKNVLLKAGVRSKNKKAFGTHLLRYSLVHALMCAHTEHSTITQALGHTNENSDRSYLSTSHEMLRECTLSLSLIGFGNGLEGGHHE